MTDTNAAASTDNTLTAEQIAAAAATPEGIAAAAAAAATPEGIAAAAAAAAKAAEDAAASEGAPEKYEDFTLPEGYTLDENLHGEFREVAKTLNLTQKQAQELVELDAKRTAAGRTTAEAQWAETQAGWKAQVLGDEVLGGADSEQKMAFTNRAIDAFGGPELRKFLDESGLGNHPDLLKAFHRAGSAISEDQWVQGNGAAAPNRLQSFYSNSDMK